MDKVIQTFNSHDIPKQIPHVLGMRTLRIGWILRWKFKNGIFGKNKARSFTRRNHREPGINYNRSFLPVMGLEYPRTSRRSLDSSTYWLGSRMRESRVRSPLLTFEYSSTNATSATYPETSVQPLPDFRAGNSGGPVPSREPPTGPQFVDRRIIATCSCTKAANFFSARQRTAIRTERSSSDHVSYPERTQTLSYPFAAWSWECPPLRVQTRANLVKFRKFRVFCARRNGTPQSSLGHLRLPPVGSTNAIIRFDDHTGLLCEQFTTSAPAQHTAYQPMLELPSVRHSGK